MKGFQIKNQCAENWNEMTPNEKGAFCSKCSKSVIDFTNKSPREINQELINTKGTQVCGRVQGIQLDNLNASFYKWESNTKTTINRAMLFSLLVVFGLSIVSCSNEKEARIIQEFQSHATEFIANEQVEKPQNTIVVEHDIEKDKRVIPATPTIASVEIQDSIIVEALDGDTMYVDLEWDDFGTNRVIMGLVSIDRSYYDYLQDSVKVVEEIEEYDSYGRLLPNEFSALLFPNPTVSNATLDFKVAQDDQFQIMLYNMKGDFIREVENKKFERGSYSFPIDLGNEPAGVYLIIIRSENFNRTLRMVKQ